MLFEDPDPDTGFMLHPDLKWVSGTQICVFLQVIRMICVAVRGTKHTGLGLCFGQDPSTGAHMQKMQLESYCSTTRVNLLQDQAQTEGLYCIALCHRCLTRPYSDSL